MPARHQRLTDATDELVAALAAIREELGLTAEFPPAAQAEAVLEALDDTREKGVVASTAVGQVKEVQLRTRFRFRLRTAAGKELIAPTEVRQSRDMSFTERAALAKEQEEASLYRAMQSDMVAQVMRRLAAVQSL